MAVRRDGNQSGSRRKKPASQGHPSRGGVTVGGGTGGKRPARYVSPPAAPRSGAPSPTARRLSQGAKAKRAAQQRVKDRDAADRARQQLTRAYREIERVERLRRKQGKGLAVLRTLPRAGTEDRKRQESMMREEGRGPAVLRKTPKAGANIIRDIQRLYKGSDKQAGAAARRLSDVGLVKLPRTKPLGPGDELEVAPIQDLSKVGKTGRLQYVKKSQLQNPEIDPIGDVFRYIKRRQLEGPHGPSVKQIAKGLTDITEFTTNPSKRREAQAAGLQSLAALGDVAAETYHHPGRTAGATAKSIPPLLAGIIPGTVAAIDNPEKAWEAIKADYAERYAGGKKTKKAVQKYGLLPFALDVGGAAAIGGRASGALAKAQGRSTGLGRLMTEARPTLRIGPGATRKQTIHPNLYVAAIQRALDKGRARRFSKQMEGNKPIRGQLPLDKDALPDIEGVDEVVHSPVGGKLSKSTRALKKLERSRHGRDVVQYRHELGRELSEMRKAISKLNKKERAGFAYVVEQGLPVDAATGTAHLDRLFQMIYDERTVRAPDGDYKLPRGTKDELNQIETIMNDYSSHVTPRSVALADRMVELLRASGRDDPGFSEVTGQMRAATPQAMAMLGDEAKPLDMKLIQDRRREQTQAQIITEAEDRLDKSIQHLEARRGEVEHEGGNPAVDPEVGALYDAVQQAQKDVEAAHHAYNMDRFSAAEQDIPESERLAMDLDDLQLARDEAQAELDEFQRTRSEWEHEFDPEELEALEAELIDDIVEITKHIETRQSLQGIMEATESAIPDMTFTGMEEVQDVLRRFTEAREARGLREGGYFPHEGGIMDRSAHSVFTRGLANRAMGNVQPTKYERFKTGRVNRDPHMLEFGLARNVKRRFNWDRVAETMDMYAAVRDKTLAQIRQYVQDNELDPRDWVAVNPGKFREHESVVEDAEFDETRSGDISNAYGSPDVRREVRSLQELPTDPIDYTNSRGWALIPKAIDDTIQSSRAQFGEGLVARGIGKYVKGLPSKLILGTNPSWLVLQFVNDAYLGALAGIGPQHIAQSERFFRRNPEAKERLVGHSGGGAFDRELQGTRLGASAQGDLAGMWRGIKRTRVLQFTGRNNPLDALIKIDKRKAQFVRRAVLHKQVQKEAWARMGQEASGFAQALDRLGVESWGKAPPDEIMNAVTKDAEFMERAAEHVNKMLGDYTTFSATERRFLERNIMFYSFLRFSLRFAFMTMPSTHPLITTLQSTLSRLHQDEVKRLLGADEDDPLPPGVLAKYYIKDGGAIKEIPLGRLNPALNAITAASGINQAAGMLPPLWNALLNQMANENVYFKSPWLVEGENQERETSRNPQGYGLENRLRIGFNDTFLSPISPLRTFAETQTGRVPTGDDSLPFDIRRTKYWNPEISTDIETQRREDLARDDDWVYLKRNVLPFLSEPTREKQRTQRYLERLGRNPVTPEQREEGLFRKIEKSPEYEELFYLYEERADLHRELKEAERERDGQWRRDVQRDIDNVERRIKRFNGGA